MSRKTLRPLGVLMGEARRIQELAKREGFSVALLGGVAMQLYGSPRMTADVDFVGDDVFTDRADIPLTPEKPLVFNAVPGGIRYTTPEGIPVDILVREDDYRTLYEAALDNAAAHPDGVRIVTPEFLAAIKLSAGRAKDNEDLLYLLVTEDLVDRQKASDIVYEYLGGQFAVEQFEGIVREADWRRSEEQ